MSDRTRKLRQLANEYQGTDFEINFSNITVLFRPDDPNGNAFAAAVRNYDRNVTIHRSKRDDWERFALSLG